MTAIEKHLHEHFASLQDTDDVPTSLPSRGAGMLGDSIPDTLDEAFAKVNTVVAGSPADSAGLQPGDEIRNFGYVNKSNHDGLKKVAECVQGNQGQNILVKISRRAEASRRQELQLTLTPRLNWGGRGMLGCHILPL
jgi:26S proteasome non-ATPase regulatory subunit 9